VHKDEDEYDSHSARKQLKIGDPLSHSGKRVSIDRIIDKTTDSGFTPKQATLHTVINRLTDFPPSDTGRDNA